MSKPNKEKKLLAVSPAAGVRLSILLIALAGFGIWGWNLSANPGSPGQAENQAKLLQAIYEYGNYIEAVIWGLFAVGFAVLTAKATVKERKHRLMATLTFFLFGLSDIVEVQTGAWWHPWWLFLWKSCCVISMVGLLIVYLRDRDS
ncbi:hypothetical protein BCD67_01020 [Oscillatoriales cyanobacterium USR001]|nr:hypothetical protein BCD67_01020 [Oscillatoriales cyanobacterium USR001]